MRDTERERQRHKQREKQALCWETDAGLDPRSPGSHLGLGLQAALTSCATRATPARTFLIFKSLYSVGLSCLGKAPLFAKTCHFTMTVSITNDQEITLSYF